MEKCLPEVFVRKPIEALAMQFTENPAQQHDVWEWVRGIIGSSNVTVASKSIVVQHGKTILIAKVDDWIVLGPMNIFHIYKPHEFASIFDKVEGE